MNLRFESFVNSEEYQTCPLDSYYNKPFESFVNSEEYQTELMAKALLVAV